MAIVKYYTNRRISTVPQQSLGRVSNRPTTRRWGIRAAPAFDASTWRFGATSWLGNEYPGNLACTYLAFVYGTGRQVKWIMTRALNCAPTKTFFDWWFEFLWICSAFVRVWLWSLRGLSLGRWPVACALMLAVAIDVRCSHCCCCWAGCPIFSWKFSTTSARDENSLQRNQNER